MIRIIIVKLIMTILSRSIVNNHDKDKIFLLIRLLNCDIFVRIIKAIFLVPNFSAKKQQTVKSVASQSKTSHLVIKK